MDHYTRIRKVTIKLHRMIEAIKELPNPDDRRANKSRVMLEVMKSFGSTPREINNILKMMEDSGIITMDEEIIYVK